jgi:phage-related protein
MDRVKPKGYASLASPCPPYVWLCALCRTAGRDEPPGAKPLKGFSGAGVLELIENYRSDTYRAVYTVRFANKVYVLHVFQKKSKRGVATPKQELDLIRDRLKLAEALYTGRGKEV